MLSLSPWDHTLSEDTELERNLYSLHRKFLASTKNWLDKNFLASTKGAFGDVSLSPRDDIDSDEIELGRNQLTAQEILRINEFLYQWAESSFPRLLSSMKKPPVPFDLSSIGDASLLLMKPAETSETSIPGERINDQITEHEARIKGKEEVSQEIQNRAGMMTKELGELNSGLDESRRQQLEEKIQSRVQSGCPSSEEEVIGFLMPNLNVHEDVAKVPLATIEEVWQTTQITWNTNYNVSKDDSAAPFHIFAAIAQKHDLEFARVPSFSDDVASDCLNKCSDFAMENGFLCPQSLFLLGSNCAEHHVKGLTLHLKLDLSDVESETDSFLTYVREGIAGILGVNADNVAFMGLRSSCVLVNVIMELHPGAWMEDEPFLDVKCGRFFGADSIGGLSPQWNKEYEKDYTPQQSQACSGVVYQLPNGWIRYGLWINKFDNGDMNWIDDP
jgi:hypothetical protein